MVLYKNLFIRRDIIYSKIYKAATACNRDMQSITIIAVTKNHPAPIWETALNLGIQHIGENKILELIQNPAILTSQSIKCMKLIDGQGIKRIIKIIKGSKAQKRNGWLN